MRLCRPSILIIACLAGLQIDFSSASTAAPKPTFESLEIAQASAETLVLKPGNTGVQVQALQTQLKELGYYDGKIDGQYGSGTYLAVSKFQQAKGLIADGIFGTTTKKMLQVAVKQKKPLTPVTSPTPKPTTQQEVGQPDIVWWSLVSIGVLGSVGALLYTIRWFRKVKKGTKPVTSYQDSSQVDTNLVAPSLQDNPTSHGQSNSPAFISPQEATNVVPPDETQLLLPETTSRLAKINIIDELIEDLRGPDPIQRRKAIWDLGQQGDSRAIQPLVELLMDADSQQRSLILAAVAEIGSRTLKPINRALAISLQDESPEVRQNAIRDMTRVYDMMAQSSQMLSHAMQDSDVEVQAAARYALSQMNRIRTLLTPDLPEDSQEEPPK